MADTENPVERDHVLASSDGAHPMWMSAADPEEQAGERVTTPIGRGLQLGIADPGGYQV